MDISTLDRYRQIIRQVLERWHNRSLVMSPGGLNYQ